VRRGRPAAPPESSDESSGARDCEADEAHPGSSTDSAGQSVIARDADGYDELADVEHPADQLTEVSPPGIAGAAGLDGVLAGQRWK
jgi:hypothetical protein